MKFTAWAQTCLFSIVLSISLFASARAESWEWKDSDRVVFLGDGLLEQEQYSGWVEAMLVASHPDLNLTFRNLGWSADTPAGESRFGLSLLQAGREPDDEGWKQLCAQLELTEPDVLILGYGMASGLEGHHSELEDRGLAQFRMDYQRLLDKAREISPGLRLLLLSPLQPLNDAELGTTLRAYSQAIQQLADANGATFVDLADCAQQSELRKDPIHLNDAGYKELAREIAQQLGLDDNRWLEHPNLDALLKVILRKNTWWFHRSRPANMAYVFGFRKHEQGQNADEIPQFDALVAEEEGRIAQLRAVSKSSISQPEPRLESVFAEFEPQAIPEFTLGDELEITLWAQNPDLNKPIHMNFDAQGRLWVASSEAYPMIEVGQSAPDKIVVLEDTDDDGVADQSTVFADGLLIPTGVLPGDGGVYVAQSTDLLFLKDTDGDGRADVKRRVLSGFGTEDTHHNLHTLLWGPDGRLYMNQSVYTRTDTETPHGVVRLKAGGGFRYDTRSMRMEIFFRGLWNSWGHQFDSFGQSFLSDGAGFAGIAYSFPGATFNPTPKARQQLDLISPGNWPKFASLEMISGESFPTAWQNSIITCDFRANRVTRFSLQEQDAGYITTQEPDLVRTSAATFRPIDVKQGPDGALYIADWSNPIINHGEVDFRDPRRDRWHGRIWRVRWKGAADRPKRDLTQLESSELLSLVKSQDRYLSHQSSRVLIERGEPARTAIRNWLEEQTDEYDKLKALWLCQATDSAAQSLLEELLVSKDHRIRAAATRVLGCWTDPGHQPKPWLTFDDPETHARFVQAVNDSHPRVRLEAIRALAKVGSLEAGTLALQALEHPMDRFLDHALFLTVNEMADPLMRSLEQQRFDGTDRQLDFILSAIEPDKAKRFLAQRLANEPLAKDGSGPWIELIGKTGGPEELDLLMMQALSRGFDEEATERAVDALVMAQRLRKTRPSKPASLDNLFGMPSEPVRLAAIRLAEVWQGQGSMTSLIDFATRDSLSMKVRLAAIQALKSIGGSQAVGALTALANDGQNQDIARASTLALAALEADTAIKPFFAILSKATSEAEALDLWRGILGVQGMGNKLAEQLQNQSLNDEQLMAGLRATRDGGRQESRLGDVLRELMGDSAASLMTPEAMLALASRVSEGDPARGEGIYRRTELACATCHAIGGIGGKVGPDMTSLGASAPVDYLVESLFIPDAKVKEGYHSSVVVTEDNQIISGIEVESTEDELVLRNAQDRLIRVPKIDIVGKKPGPSLMPVGVVDRLSEQEQLDLLSFLSQLGKPGPFDASQGGVAREYGVLAGTHRREQQGIEQIISGEIDGWQPLKSLVNGDLPRQELVELTRQPINIALVHVYLKTRIEVARDTTVRLSVPTSAGMWVNGQPIEGDRDFSTELPTGQHVVVIRLDARDLPEQFRLESKDVTFLALDD